MWQQSPLGLCRILLFLVTKYNVVILAIAPLQRLWEKAKDKQMVSYFGDPTQIEKLLDLITPVPGSEFHNHCIFLVLF